MWDVGEEERRQSEKREINTVVSMAFNIDLKNCLSGYRCNRIRKMQAGGIPPACFDGLDGLAGNRDSYYGNCFNRQSGLDSLMFFYL